MHVSVFTDYIIQAYFNTVHNCKYNQYRWNSDIQGQLPDGRGALRLNDYFLRQTLDDMANGICNMDFYHHF